MKKIILSALALILVGACCVDVNAQEKTKEQLKAEAAAQKALKKEFDGYLKVAKKNSQSGEGLTPNVAVAREAIANAAKSPLAEGNAEYYLVAGQVEQQALNEAAQQQPADYAGYAAAASAGFQYFKQAYDAASTAAKPNTKIMSDAQAGAFQIYNMTSGLSMIGNVYYQLQEYDKCLAAFRVAKTAGNEKVLTSNPLAAAVVELNMADSTINNLCLNCFSVAQYQLNDTTEAIKELLYLKEHAMDDNQLNQVLQSLALDYYAMDDTVKFEATLNEGVQRLPSEQWYVQNLINVYIGRGDLTSAGAFLDKAIEADPSNAQLVSTKGQLLEQQEKFDEALTYYEKALELDPTSYSINSSMGRYYYNRAQVIEDDCYNRKKWDEADRLATPLYDKALPYYEAAYAFDTERKDKNICTALSMLYGRRVAKIGASTAEGKELTAKRKEVRAAYGFED